MKIREFALIASLIAFVLSPPAFSAENGNCALIFSSPRAAFSGDFKLKKKLAVAKTLSHADEVAARKREQDAERDAIRSLEPKDVRRLALKAASKFDAYFRTIGKTLYERDNLLELFRVALIAEEHILIMGSPGNAKSKIADMVLGNIIDDRGRNSYFRIQMTPETTMSETHGPMDYKKLEATGEYDRLHKQGMGAYRNVFVDEIADARANATRNILGFLAERTYPQGSHVIEGAIETVVAATNRYLSEWYLKAGDDGPRGVVDRFALVAFMQANFEFTDSYVKLIRGLKQGSLPELRFSEIEALRALTEQVEISEAVAKIVSLVSDRMKAETEGLEAASLKDYDEKIKNGERPNPSSRATKLHSGRTLGKAAKILRAFVVDDWVAKRGKRKLEATIEDVAQLQKFFALNGPHDEFVGAEMARTSNEHERAQLKTIIQEREIFVRVYNHVVGEIEVGSVPYRLSDFAELKSNARTPDEKQAAAQQIMAALAKVVQEKKPNLRQSELDGAEIAKDFSQSYLEGLLKGLVSREEFGRLQSSVYAEIERVKKEAAEIPERERKEAAARAMALQREEARRLAIVAAEKAEAEKRSQELREVFVNPAKYHKITVRAPEDGSADFLFAHEPDRNTSVVYYKEQDEVVVIESTATGDTETVYHGVLIPEAGDIVFREAYFSGPRTVTFISSDGKAIAEFDLDKASVKAAPISIKPLFTSYDARNRRLISFEPKTLKLILSKDGVTEDRHLKFVPNGHWTDSVVKALTPAGEDMFRVADNGSYAVLITSRPRKVFHLNFHKGEITPIAEPSVGETFSELGGPALGFGNYESDIDSNSNSDIQTKYVRILDVSGVQPAITNLKLTSEREIGYGENASIAHVAGTDLLLLPKDSDGTELMLVDGTSGKSLADDVFALEDGDSISSVKAFPGGFAIAKSDGVITIVKLKK